MATEPPDLCFMPSGYLYKQAIARPEWLNVPSVDHIHSVSGCMAPVFADYIPYWKHNGLWLFDTPQAMHPIAVEEGVDLATFGLFYYETYPEAFDGAGRAWIPVAPDQGLVLVAPPPARRLLGFDVVCFSCGNAPECSPLSCNRLAETIPVNRHCLFGTFEEAKAALEAGHFAHTEPGPYRIMSVYAVD